METYQIILLIISILVGLYIVVGIVVVAFTLAFKYKVDKREESISLLISQKYDMLMGIVDEFELMCVNIPESILHNIKGKRDINFTSLTKKERDLLLSSYSQANYQLKLLAEQNKMIDKSSKFQALMASFDEIDEIYRLNVAIYNSDVTGYNYWVSFKGYTYIFKIFKMHKKEILL